MNWLKTVLRNSLAPLRYYSFHSTRLLYYYTSCNNTNVHARYDYQQIEIKKKKRKLLARFKYDSPVQRVKYSGLTEKRETARFSWTLFRLPRVRLGQPLRYGTREEPGCKNVSDYDRATRFVPPISSYIEGARFDFDSLRVSNKIKIERAI